METSPHHAPSSRLRLITLSAASLAVITAGALFMMLVAVATLCRARRLYAAIACRIARLILWMWGIRLEIVHHGGGWPGQQVVYVSNHPSTIDLFALVALGLPNTRFFLSGFLQKYVPLGIIARLMGTFFTVPQDRPRERVRIFQRADRILRRTGESVYLSPEGQRVPTGQIGPFNKGAFHLAASLRAPIVPIYFDVPPEVDPGRSFDAAAGTVTAHVHPAIDTSSWSVEEALAHRDTTRALFLRWHQEARA